MTVGYGFGALNINKHVMRIEGGRDYDFFQTSYLYERPCHRPNVAVILEPFAAYINRPNTGVDVGFNAGIKWYPYCASRKGLSSALQTGICLIPHGQEGRLFYPQATLLPPTKTVFEDRFKHYSTGGRPRQTDRFTPT